MNENDLYRQDAEAVLENHLPGDLTPEEIEMMAHLLATVLSGGAR
ncbi:hypothetical protein ACFUN8_35830 [Streptomyces sp. NPDC057307]